MIRLRIKYETEEEKNKIIKIVSAGANYKTKGEPSKSGKYYKLYLDIE